VCGGVQCDGNDHSECPVCGGTLCDDGNHSTCLVCGDPYCNGLEHGTDYGQCGNLNTSALVTCLKCGISTAPYEMHLGDCNLHYTCQTGTSRADHEWCYACDGYRCDGQNHDACEHCGMPVCDGQSHGTGEGQCSYGADASATLLLNRTTAARNRPYPMLPGLAIAGLAILLPLRRRRK